MFKEIIPVTFIFINFNRYQYLFYKKKSKKNQKKNSINAKAN